MKRPAKRRVLALYNIIMVLLLCGCGLRGQARELDQLLVVQTMGCDLGGPGLVLSLATGARPGSPPERLQASGSSVTEALARIRAGTSEEELFCAHLRHLLIGEKAAAEGLEACLDYVCRSGDLRLSVPLYVLRGAEAREAVLGAGDESFGVCDALDAVDAELRRRGDGHITTAAALLRDLARSDSALVCAVSLQPSAAADRSAEAGESPRTLAPDGYAVLKNGRLCGFLDKDQALGVGFLTGHTGLAELIVTDQAGLPVTLSLTGGSCAPEPRLDENGALRSLSVSVEAEAVVAESAAGGTELAYLQNMAERALSERIRQVLRLSKQWQADFLGLARRLDRDPRDFAERWPSLPLTVSVSVRLSGTGDVEGAP